MPITHEILKLIIASQREEHLLPKHYIERDLEPTLIELAHDQEITVLTGLRRSGKSVLLQYIRQHSRESDYYFNFEDERLVEFTVQDFQHLHEVFIELFGVQHTFFFDEIQNIPGWEMFIRRLYNSGNKIFITGSNANLFSEELGTRLTGRYIPVSVYPISFKEYVQYANKALSNAKPLSDTQQGQMKQLFANYCREGSIPEFIKHQRTEYLHALYESILYRDIVARYKLPNDILIKKLVFYLASNCSKEMSYNALKKLTGVGSATTISDYCHYLENSYLCFFLNRYNDSVKVQIQSPKKVYFIDTTIAQLLGFRISEDAGRLLENIVFLALKRQTNEIYYYHENKECDFIVREGARTTAAIQVCKDISDIRTKQREIAGLVEALTRFSLNHGLLLTEHAEGSEDILHEGKTFHIQILPVWKWLTL